MNNPFNMEDYNSNDGMLTYVWGPPLWHSLHTMSFNYPVSPTREQKQQYYAFFKSLQWVLPCSYCRDNYKKNLKILPLNSQSLLNRNNFTRWLYDLHNLVNKNLNKPITLTYEEVRNRYENFRSRCIKDPDEKISDTKKEKGCTTPLYGKKAHCVLNIVPLDKKVESLNISKDTILKTN